MAQFLGFGNGSDGAATLSGTDAPIDSSCSGSSGATSLTATNASFAADQLILIHQSRGTGAGAWEINKIDSYVAGTITTVLPLANTYTDSGASQAQVLVLKQYSSVTISGTLNPKVWDGDLGGIIAFLCNGTVTISGTLSTRNGTTFSTNSGFIYGLQTTTGESQLAASPSIGDGSANGGAGRGAVVDQSGGGGAGHANVGTAGSGSGGAGGLTYDTADLTTFTLGSGGGGGRASGNSRAGRGAGAILIFADTITLTGTIDADGSPGESPSAGDNGGGGGGAGGSIFLKGTVITLGANLVTATGGAGGIGSGNGANGGAGSVGRIRIEACSRTGTTNPSASESIGGHDFCASTGAIL